MISSKVFMIMFAEMLINTMYIMSIQISQFWKLKKLTHGTKTENIGYSYLRRADIMNVVMFDCSFTGNTGQIIKCFFYFCIFFVVEK